VQKCNRAALSVFDLPFGMPGRDVDLAFPLVRLGLLTATGRAREAEPLLVEAVAVRRTHLAADHRDVVDAERALADCRAP